MRIRIATVLAVTTSVLVAGSPAYAASRTFADPAGDVVSLGPADDETLAEPAPDRREGDVLSLRVVHAPKQVRAVMRFDELTRPTGRQQTVHVFSIRTSKGAREDVSLLVDRRHRQGVVVERPCRATTTRIDYAADTVRITVPRRCLGKPAWVRMGAGGGTITRAGTLFADDALVDGAIDEELALGQKVRR